jgi:hypothetical protein
LIDKTDYRFLLLIACDLNWDLSEIVWINVHTRKVISIPEVVTSVGPSIRGGPNSTGAANLPGWLKRLMKSGPLLFQNDGAVPCALLKDLTGNSASGLKSWFGL